jgi:hypothetical protein
VSVDLVCTITGFPTVSCFECCFSGFIEMFSINVGEDFVSVFVVLLVFEPAPAEEVPRFMVLQDIIPTIKGNMIRGLFIVIVTKASKIANKRPKSQNGGNN